MKLNQQPDLGICPSCGVDRKLLSKRCEACDDAPDDEHWLEWPSQKFAKQREEVKLHRKLTLVFLFGVWAIFHQYHWTWTFAGALHGIAGTLLGIFSLGMLYNLHRIWTAREWPTQWTFANNLRGTMAVVRRTTSGNLDGTGSRRTNCVVKPSTSWGFVPDASMLPLLVDWIVSDSRLKFLSKNRLGLASVAQLTATLLRLSAVEAIKISWDEAEIWNKTGEQIKRTSAAFDVRLIVAKSELDGNATEVDRGFFAAMTGPLGANDSMERHAYRDSLHASDAPHRLSDVVFRLVQHCERSLGIPAIALTPAQAVAIIAGAQLFDVRIGRDQQSLAHLNAEISDQDTANLFSDRDLALNLASTIARALGLSRPYDGPKTRRSISDTTNAATSDATEQASKKTPPKLASGPRLPTPTELLLEREKIPVEHELQLPEPNRQTLPSKLLKRHGDE